MINLLPESQKSEIRAARANVLLVRYIAILTAAILVLGGIIVAAYVVLETKKAATQDLLDVSKARAAQYQPVSAEADALRASLSSAKSILDQKTSYTKLIYKIADSIPPGIVLETLDLDPATFGSPMTINANAKSFESASKLRDEFASNSDIFSDVKLLSLGSGSSSDNSSNSDSAGNSGNVSVSGSSSEYPVKVSISLTINKAALR